MKKILNLFVGGSICLFTGCVDLNQEPQSFLTPENIDYTEKNVTSLTNGLYKALWYGNYGYNCRTQILGIGADDLVSGSPSKRYTFADELYMPSNDFNGDLETMWKNMYGLAQASCQLIEGLTATTTITEEEKKTYLGEAHFLRGFAYFNLVRWFGNVPAFTDSKCVEDILGSTKIVRNQVEDVYLKLIIPDLQIAEEYLNDISRTKNNASASKWAASACLADVYITMAGWPLKKTEYYKQAQNKAAEIIESGRYKLVGKYEDLWKEATKSSDEEHIFALNHSVKEQASNYGTSYFTSFEEKGWSDYLADSTFYESYPNDERKAFNFVTKFIVNKRPIDFRKTQMRCPAVNKYRDYGGVSSAQSAGITPIYRYAEILLLYAEAQNKADHGPNDLSKKYLMQVQSRAQGGAAVTLPDNLDEESFDKLVFDERGWEFFAEFKRWFQLIRTEKVYDVNQFNPLVKKGIENRGITKDNRQVYLMQIPTREQQDCGFEQNPR